MRVLAAHVAAEAKTAERKPFARAVPVVRSWVLIENCLVPFRGKEVRHERTHEWLGNGLFEPDRQRRILIRKLGKGFRHEKVPRYAQHDCQDPLIEHRFPKFFLQKVGVDSDDLHHVPTQGREMVLIHRLHITCPQLRFAVASHASERRDHRRPQAEAAKPTAPPSAASGAYGCRPLNGTNLTGES